MTGGRPGGKKHPYRDIVFEENEKPLAI